MKKNTLDLSDYEIGICDDQAIAIELLEKNISEIHNELEVGPCNIHTYLSPKKAIEAANELNILFLDLDMPEMDGITAGKLVHSKNPDCNIIIASSHTNRMQEGYFIQATRFITKPYQKTEIMEALLACEKNKTGQNEIEMYLDRIPYSFPQHKISYIRAFNGYVEFEVGNTFFRRDCTLQKIEEELDPQLFYRIHKSYIVNLNCISSYANGIVEIGEKSLPVSFRRRTDFQKKFISFDLENH